MKIIKTNQAPSAIGPYSQAIMANNMIYLSGQIPLEPATMQVVTGDIQVQTHQVFKNIQHVLAAANSELSKVVKVNIFLKDMADFAAINEVYAEYFQEHKPARSCVEVARLPKDVSIEIECIALI